MKTWSALFEVASKFRVDPWKLAKKWTNRQFQIAVSWVDAQWNCPDRSDHYAMQTALMMSSGSRNLSEFKIKFERKQMTTIKRLSDDEVEQHKQSQMMLLSIFGWKPGQTGGS